MRLATLIGLLAGCAMWVPALRAEAPNKQIRVIVDTSQSLRTNDPSGYVKLATELLYDLAWQTFNAKDSFKVGIFDPTWPKTPTPPPKLRDQLILTPGRSAADRESFLRKMRETGYDGPWTYFSPCLEWAYEDLRNSGSSADDRIIVLITDGMPDDFAQEADRARLTALVPQLHNEHIRVFVLAFGPEVQKEWFDQAFRFGDPDGVAGQTFAGVDAGHLASDMVEIFSRSFGYSRQVYPSIPSQIDVSGQAKLERAAVVALYEQGGEPRFELSPPPGSSTGPQPVETEVGKPEPAAKRPSHSVSYAYQWLIPPAKGSYGLKFKGPAPSQVAVLRPIRVEAKIRSYQGDPTDAVMAGKPASMEVLVYPAAGLSGDPGGEIEVHYTEHYFQQNNSLDPKVYSADPAGPGRQTPEGRVFLIHPQFVRDPPGANGNKYLAFIDVEVWQYGTPVERMGERMHPVQVYPYISIRPSPAESTAKAGGNGLLHSGDEGCAEFQFEGNAQSFGEGGYTIGVRLDPPPASSGAFRGAKFRFDGKELSNVAPGSGAWQATERFDPRELDARGGKAHRFCIWVGHPTKEEKDRVLAVHFGLWQNSSDPYERLNVVDNLSFATSIAAPDFWQGLGPWLTLLFSLLLMLLSLLLWRSRQALAPDLTVALGERAGSMAPSQLGEQAIGARWLGLAQDRPVISLGGNREIGRVRPLDRELFAFLPGRGVGNVYVEDGGEWRPLDPLGDGSWQVAAGKTYRAGAGEEASFFRLEYSSDRPRV